MFQAPAAFLLDLVTALTLILTVLGEQVVQGGKLELQDSPGPAADRLQLRFSLTWSLTSLFPTHIHPVSLLESAGRSEHNSTVCPSSQLESVLHPDFIKSVLIQKIYNLALFRSIFCACLVSTMNLSKYQ